MYCSNCGGFGFVFVKLPDGSERGESCKRHTGPALLRQSYDAPEPIFHGLKKANATGETPPVLQ